MEIKKSKLSFKGKKSKGPKVEKVSKSLKKKTEEANENAWVDCANIDDIYGPVVLISNDLCLCYDTIRGFHTEAFDTSPKSISQVFVISKIFGHFGIANSDGFYLNNSLKFNGSAMGKAEQFSIEFKNDKFLLKSSNEEYLSIDGKSLNLVKGPSQSCFFKIKCQSEIIRQLKNAAKTKIIKLDSSVGMPKGRSRDRQYI